MALIENIVISERSRLCNIIYFPILFYFSEAYLKLYYLIYVVYIYLTFSINFHINFISILNK